MATLVDHCFHVGWFRIIFRSLSQSNALFITIWWLCFHRAPIFIFGHKLPLLAGRANHSTAYSSHEQPHDCRI